MRSTFGLFTRLALIVAFVSTVGCIPIYRDVSRATEYKRYVGTTAILNTEQDLSLHRKKNYLSNTHYSQYTFTKWDGTNGMNPDEYFIWREPLKKGTEIKILAFKRGNDEDHVLMEVFSHTENRKVRVQDTFGLTRVQSVDVERKLGYLTFPDINKQNPKDRFER